MSYKSKLIKKTLISTLKKEEPKILAMVNPKTGELYANVEEFASELMKVPLKDLQHKKKELEKEK